MPEIIISTNDGDCANGVAEINPFTVGDATDEWTLKFNNGTDFYAPSNVTMRVGHTNGLPDGTYSNAFKWVDRADNRSTGSINVSGGVPALSFDSNPMGGVVGGNGVYILRGPELDGRITGIDIVDKGHPYWYYCDTTTKNVFVGEGEPTEMAIVTYTREADTSVNLGSNSPGQMSYVHHEFSDNTGESSPRYWTDVTNVTSANSPIPGSTRPTLSTSQLASLEGIYDGRNIALTPSNGGSHLFGDQTGTIKGDTTGSGSISTAVHCVATRSRLSSISISNPGAGFTVEPKINFSEGGFSKAQYTGVPSSSPVLNVRIARAKYEFPFKRDESGNNIIAATTLSPYSDGQVKNVTEYDHSTLVIRPETVATASLTQSGTDWVGTMNPINSYVTQRLALRNSTQLDIQIRGDGRTLFQGQLTVLNKIA